jgi:nucleotide-binding universal stress UspA family protein
MTVAIAHQPSSTGHLVLREAVREAALRNTPLVVIQVNDAVDLDKAAAHEATLAEQVPRLARELGVTDIAWSLRLTPGVDVDDTAATILHQATEADAELLVIGARRRSPVGKLLLGSTAQTLILTANTPILVVKDSG